MLAIPLTRIVKPVLDYLHSTFTTHLEVIEEAIARLIKRKSQDIRISYTDSKDSRTFANVEKHSLELTFDLKPEKLKHLNHERRYHQTRTSITKLFAFFSTLCTSATK